MASGVGIFQTPLIISSQLFKLYINLFKSAYIYQDNYFNISLEMRQNYHYSNQKCFNARICNCTAITNAIEPSKNLQCNIVYFYV